MSLRHTILYVDFPVNIRVFFNLQEEGDSSLVRFGPPQLTFNRVYEMEVPPRIFKITVAK